MSARTIRPLGVTTAGDEVELRSSALSVRLDRRTLAVTIVDDQGHVVLSDAPGHPLRFENGGFRLRKAMPLDQHFFGLGDKTGPLDRRGSAFTLWNTDQFGFGPSTDPLYKSIPFMLGLGQWRARVRAVHGQ